MTDRQTEDLKRAVLRVAAATLSLVVWGVALWIFRTLSGVEPGTALQVGLLFLAIFGGHSAVRSIGEIFMHDERRGKGRP